jgi:signal transduction histidine kinase
MRVGRSIAFAFVAFCVPAGTAAQVAPHPTVMVIHSGAETFPANPILDAGIREVLASRSDLSINYFAEYLETDYFPGEEELEAFSDYIRRKYEGYKIDVVIAITDTALQFALARREMLFPDAPIVFSGLTGVDERTRLIGAGVTGLKVAVAYGETLKLALELQPSIERVFIVANGRNDGVLEPVRAAFRPFSPRVTVSFLSEESMPRLLDAVRAVPPRSVILYIWHHSRDPGNVVYPDEVAGLVAEAASVPVYGTSDFYVGTGVVGGVVRGTRKTGTRLGEMALQILGGTRAQDIPMEAPQLEPYLDWRQVRKWGISEARVPSGTVIRFREPSTWDAYKFHILGAVTIMLAQSILIGALLVQSRRRRHAEEQVRGSESKLRSSYDRIRDLGARLLNAQDTERSRVARELHDDISQQVALLCIDIELLNDVVQEGGERLVHDATERASELAKRIHGLSHQLHPQGLRLIGLVPALETLQHELSRPETAIVFAHDTVPPSVPAEVTLCLFRVVQEALQNALKYSKAKMVSIHLQGNSDSVTLSVVDDGIGFDVEHLWGTGLGLISMRERVESVRGTFEIHSRPGNGTRLEIHVPLDR